MRWEFFGIFFGCMMWLAAGAAAQTPAPARDCTVNSSAAPEQRIKSCTTLIENGQASAHDRAVAYKNRGNAYLDERDDDRAMADYDAAIRLDPSLAAAYNDRGDVWLDRANPDRAIAQFDAALRLDPKFMRAFGGRVSAYLQKGDFDRALTDADAEVRLAPKSAGPYISRGDVYGLKGDFEAAIADFNQAIRLDPKYANAYNDLGSTYAAMGDAGRAVKEFSKTIRLDPRNHSPYYNRGRTYFFAGALPKALADFRQANALAPQDAYPALWLDIAEARANMPSTLPHMAAKLDMTAWPAPVIRMFLGKMTPAAVLAAAADPNTAKQATDVCEAHFYSGEWALRQHAKKEAKRLFGFAASNCPKWLNEGDAAKAEIKALGAKP